MLLELPELIMTQSEGKIVYINNEFLKVINASNQEDILGGSVSDYVPLELKDAIRDQVREEDCSAKVIEHQILAKDGSWIDVEITGVAIVYKGCPSIQLIFRDITEQKRIGQELNDYKQRYLSLFELNPDGVYSMDDKGMFTHTNQALADILGYSIKELSTMTAHDVVDPAFLDQSIQSFRKSLDGSQQNYETLGIHRDGSRIPVHIMNMPIMLDGQISGAYGIVKDISDKKRAHRLLEESEAKYRSLFEHTLDAILEIDVNGFYINANEVAEKITGYSKKEFLEMSYSNLIAENLEEMHESFTKIIDGNAVYVEQRFYTKNGDVKNAEVGAVPIWRNGKVDGVFAIIKDITEKKQNQKRINELAYTDQLTGLPNRHCFFKDFNNVITKVKEEKQSIAILAIDFDNFKAVNDKFGHHAGDLFLRKVSKQMKACLREEDKIARIGGDEFIIVLENVTEDDVSQIAQRIIREMNQPIHLYDHQMVVTLSIGISMYDHKNSDIDSVIKEADFAMYLAKESGKNNYQFFTEDISKTMTEKDQLEKALHHAIEQEELKLYYQPQVDLQTGELVGLEVRPQWHAPFGVISPNDFIPVAEETGMIGQIGEWAFKEICRQIKQWTKQGNPVVKVSVNVPARQLRGRDFYLGVKSILEEEDINPSNLEFQITESVILDVEESEQVIKELKELGLKIAIDDFGAGYSSLNFIKNIEVDSLKVDKTLINDVLKNERTLSILSVMVSVGEKLNTNIIIDGIETEMQWDLLQEFTVVGQGAYLSQPLAPEHMNDVWNRKYEGV